MTTVSTKIGLIIFVSSSDKATCLADTSGSHDQCYRLNSMQKCPVFIPECSTCTSYLPHASNSPAHILQFYFKEVKLNLLQKSWSNPDRFLTTYRRHKNLLTKLTRAAHEQYYSNLLEFRLEQYENMVKNINCILGEKHSSISTTIKLNGIYITELEIIENVFNSYLNSIPITLSDNINNNLTVFESYIHDQIPE